ncbi:MAG: hypothetical protein U1E57_08075 [Paenacidovorax caeni]
MGICYPIAGGDLDEILVTWRQFDLNVLAGVPTTLMKLLERLTPEEYAPAPANLFVRWRAHVRGGQDRRRAGRVPRLPGALSIGVAGVDYGELGWASPGGAPGVHHCFDASTVMLELLDGTASPSKPRASLGASYSPTCRRLLCPSCATRWATRANGSIRPARRRGAFACSGAPKGKSARIGP